ncbi:BolA domain UV induced protein Uvi31 [Schizosaccharomyces japonicus yFS275]|uniref:BolA domain UV induced protein Uvi31 n=1 Tax=Schizosaccharomyces japonicus (strain yFS275 / FY16936) TaxID=402676 RepID=B6K4H1_SCHJY|nr:BolA domain UV induced protein Uvi31 [Schizosaccharomyces japonicus yFS275]EEB08378.1 BolA domain UV induced protein Uvi31 [Schizosaccharomyces japonicus yFS275]
MLKRALNMLSRHERIQQVLESALKPKVLTIRNDSNKHSHHKNMTEGLAQDGFTHFCLDVVSDEFTGMNRPARHRLIYKLLQPEFDTGLHALQIRTAKTVAEAEQ